MDSNIDNRFIVLEISGIGTVPIAVKPDECVRELRDRLCLEPGLRVLHDGKVLKDSAILPVGSSVLVAPPLVGGGDEALPQDIPSKPTVHSTMSASASSNSNSLSSSLSKSRCSAVGCSDRPARIIGDCRYCQRHYCSKHRLPEAHRCDKIEHCRQQSYEKNSDRLLNGKCVADKM